MWEYYHDGGEYFDIIWLGLVAGSGLGILYYIWEYFDKKKILKNMMKFTILTGRAL